MEGGGGGGFGKHPPTHSHPRGHTLTRFMWHRLHEGKDMCRGAAPGSHLTTTGFALATLFLLFFIRDVSDGTPQQCKKSALYSHFCPGVTGGVTRRLNHLKPSSLSFLHHVRGHDNTVQSPREKQQNQSRARSHSNTTAWKGKSLCNPLLPSQEKAWKDPGSWDLCFAESQQQRSGLFRAAGSPYLISSAKQKLSGRSWEGTVSCPHC